MDARTTVYKKKDIIYNLKMKASRRKDIVLSYNKSPNVIITEAL